MARSFSKEEAKTAITKSAILVDKLHKVVLSAPGFRNAVAIRINELLDAKAKSFADGADFTNYQDSLNRARAGVKINFNNFDIPESVKLVKAVYMYLLTMPLIGESARILSGLVEDSALIEDEGKIDATALMMDPGQLGQSVAALGPATNGFVWLITPKAKKEKAEQAYSFIQSVLQSDDCRRALYISKRFKELKTPSDSEAISSFKANENAFISIVESIGPEATGDDFWPFTSRDAIDLVNHLREPRHKFRDLEKLSESKNADVEEAVDRLVSSELLGLLKDIPVDEVARHRSGIRFKALKDNGYETMADVFTSRAYELENVRGIGPETAFDVKSYADQCAQDARKTIKVRLSTDNKTKEATGLVKALYACVHRDELVREARPLLDALESLLSTNEGNLSIARRPESWLSASPDQILHAEETYRLLQSALEGELVARINALIAAVEKVDKSYYTRCVDASAAWDAFAHNPVDFYNVLEAVSPGVLGNDDSLYGLPEDLAREIQDECYFPDGLKCTLRGYQEWGVKYILHQGKVLLGDEMGLGKTVQAIATMVSLKNIGQTHFAVVCPASVLENWMREIRKHSKLRPVKVHGPTAEESFEGWMRNGGVVVTTYETIRKLNYPEDFTFGLCVIDEAHFIKNPDAARTKNSLHLCEHGERLLFMTGTALENNVDEMISLLKDLNPEVAGKARSMAFMSGAKQFRDIIAPVYYRRKRDEVLSELPELIENEDWCNLEGEELERYNRSVLNEHYMSVRRVSFNVGDLRNSSKARRLKEIVEDARDDGRKVIVFTYFLATAKAIEEFLGPNRCAGYICGSVPIARRQKIIDDFEKAPDGSVLISQIQSGGTGLNIQAASVVVICEPQFKPSIEVQAIARAHRMGQARNVLVHRLLCSNTVDEKILKVLKDKQAIFDAFADKSSAVDAAGEAAKIDTATFGNIIKEEIERIKAENPGLAAEVEKQRASDANSKEVDSSEFDSMFDEDILM